MIYITDKYFKEIIKGKNKVKKFIWNTNIKISLKTLSSEILLVNNEEYILVFYNKDTMLLFIEEIIYISEYIDKQKKGFKVLSEVISQKEILSHIKNLKG